MFQINMNFSLVNQSRKAAELHNPSTTRLINLQKIQADSSLIQPAFGFIPHTPYYTLCWYGREIFQDIILTKWRQSPGRVRGMPAMELLKKQSGSFQCAKVSHVDRRVSSLLLAQHILLNSHL